MKRLVIASLASTLAACTLGPNYSRPAIETPDHFRGADVTLIADTHSLADTKWFDLFQDETLKQLLTTALKQNFDLRIAAERVLQAREQFRITRSDQFPTIDGSASYTASRPSRIGATRALPPGADPDASYTEIGFSLGWELDIWGRLRRLTESARAQYLATEHAQRGVVTTLVGDLTETYLALRELDLELEIAQRTRDVATESLELTELRRDRGVATGLDVRQAEQLLYTATAQIAATERDIAQTENALSFLIGQHSQDVPRGQSLDAFKTPPVVPAGLPSSLLERRPDILQAEQILVSANAQIGAAKAEYFPRISLTGFFGAQSRALSSLLTSPAGLWSASAGAAAPIFNAGRTRATVRLTEAVQREAVIGYQRTIYNAFREVADSLVGYRKTSEQRAEQERLVEALRDSTRLSTSRYQGGLDSYLQVLDAERNRFQGELDLARLQQQELASIVQLYRALGGGWNCGLEGAECP